MFIHLYFQDFGVRFKETSEYEVSLVYEATVRKVRATQRNLALKKQTKN